MTNQCLNCYCLPAAAVLGTFTRGFTPFAIFISLYLAAAAANCDFHSLMSSENEPSAISATAITSCVPAKRIRVEQL